MAAYDDLIQYLQKHGETRQEVCLTFLQGYKHKNNAYRALADLVRQHILYREVRKKDGTYYGLVVNSRAFDKKSDKQPLIEHSLEDWAKLYRFFVRYGAQHFSAIGRVKFMSVMKAWLREYDDLVQFPMLLRDMLTRDVSHMEFLELEKGLKEAGWYQFDYDAADQIGQIIHILNPAFEIQNYLDYPEATWQSLYDLDGLDRAISHEGIYRILPPHPSGMGWHEYRDTHRDKFTEQELYREWREYNLMEH